MCKFWSCVIDRRLKVWSDGNSSSHEVIIEKAGLNDNKLEDRDFVRLEILEDRGYQITKRPKRKGVDKQ